MLVYHLINFSPTRKSTYLPIVNEHISLNFPTVVVVLIWMFLWIILVDGPEIYTTLMTPVNGILQKLSLTHTPKNELMVLFDQHAQRLRGKRYLWAYLRIAVLNDGSIEINCYYHILSQSTFILVIDRNPSYQSFTDVSFLSP